MIPKLSFSNVRQAHRCRVRVALVLYTLIITVSLAFSTQTRTALAATDIQLTEIVVDKPDAGGEIVLGSKTRLSAFGDVSMLMYFEFPSRIPWLYLQDNVLGETSHIELPHYQTNTVIPKAEHVLTDLDEAVTLHGDGSALMVREYELTGTPLPSLATLVGEFSFGDSDSRPRSLIKLRSGALLAVWYQQTANTDNSISLGFAYRDPQGEWSSTFPVMIGNASSTITSASISMVQHPADDSIWVFCKRDSFHRIEAVHLSETPVGIHVDWIESDFITDNSDGENGPESERPDLVAVADVLNNSILLAYQSHTYSFFSFDPFVKGAHITIAKIAQDGSRSYRTLATFVERITRIGLVADEGKAWLAYRPINESTLSFDEVYVNRYDFVQQSWDGPILLDTLHRDQYYDNSDEALAYGSGQVDFAGKMADGHIHFYRLKPVSSDINTPPLAASQLVTTEQETPVAIELSATDADGHALRYTVVSDPGTGSLTGTAPYLTYTPAPGFTGADTFDFVANDGLADSTPATVSVTVHRPPNLAPLASLSADPGSGEVTLALTLDGSASLDQDGEIVRYDWDFGDGSSMPGGPATTTHSYTVAGNYLVTLKVTDDRGAIDSASLSIEVLPASSLVEAPSDLSVAVSGSKVTLRWVDNAGNEEGAYVERGIREGGTIRFERIAQLDADATSFVETLPRGNYFYRVQAFNMKLPAPLSEYSNTKKARVRKKKK